MMKKLAYLIPLAALMSAPSAHAVTIAVYNNSGFTGHTSEVKLHPYGGGETQIVSPLPPSGGEPAEVQYTGPLNDFHIYANYAQRAVMHNDGCYYTDPNGDRFGYYSVPEGAEIEEIIVKVASDGNWGLRCTVTAEPAGVLVGVRR